ncbi:MAG: hypothetical protein ACKV2Q_16825 [Planctomycetaceae bacterium]
MCSNAVMPASQVETNKELQVRCPEAFCESPTNSGELRYSDALRQWIITLHTQSDLSGDWYDDSTRTLSSEERFFAFQEFDHLKINRECDLAFEQAYRGWTDADFARQEAEVAAEREARKLLPPNEKSYLDGPHHGSPEAHRVYGEEFLKTASEIFEKWLANADDWESFSETADRLREARSAAKRAVNSGLHYFLYAPDHALEAARHRARHQAADCIRQISDRIENGDEFTGVLFTWLRDLKTWAGGIVDERNPPPWPACMYEPKPLSEADRQPVASVQPATPHVVPEPLPPLPPPGFCSEFVRYANTTARREQPLLALLASLALIATLAGRKYRDSFDTRMNLYLIGLAKTGSGKDHARKIVKKLLAACDRANLLVESFASGPAVVKAVSDRSGECLALIDEFGKYLSVSTAKNAQSYQSQILTVRMRLYTSADTVYVGDSYGATDRKELVIDQPNLCLYGSTTPSTFFSALSSANVTSGLLNRLVAIEVDDDLPPNRQPKLEPLPSRLAEACRFWSNLKAGDNLLSPELLIVAEDDTVTARFDQFSQKCDAIARTDRTPFTRDIFVRVLESARKLTLVYAISESFCVDAETGIHPEPRITLQAAEWAIAFATYCANYTEKALGSMVSDNLGQANAKLVLRLVAEAGGTGMPHSLLARKLDHAIPARDLRLIIESLAETGQIVVEKRGAGTHKASVYFASPHAP